MKRALFPGSFDPLTLGHFDIIERGVTLFDELWIAIGINADKKYMFSLEERQQFISEAFSNSKSAGLRRPLKMKLASTFLQKSTVSPS